MRRYVALILTGSLILSLPVKSVGSDDSNFELQTQNDIDRLVSKSSGQTDPDPWHFNNLYDPSSNSFFIPYHLWSGADWNGKKSTENCMHRVKNRWKFVDARGRDRKMRVAGPTKLIHPVTGITYETWELKTKRGSQNLVCHSRGIARVFDFRFSENEQSQLNGTECKFPAGYGWQLGASRDCDPDAPKETTVTKLIFSKDLKLVKMAYTYTKKKGFETQRADDYYEYETNKGRILHSKL